MSAETKTAVVLPDPAKSFRGLVDHIAEHGIDHDIVSDSHVRFSREGCTFAFSHEGQELRIAITAPNENMLFFLKEAAAAHVVEIDPVAGEELVWIDADATPNTGDRPVNFHELQLVGRREAFPGMIRLTLSGDTAGHLADGGLHVKLMRPAVDHGKAPQWPTVAANGITVWPQGDQKLHVRYFTIRHARPEAGEVDIDVVYHAGGMISDWAVKASPGDVIGVMGPAGGSLPGVDGPVLLAGDETALPAIARIMETLPAGQQGTVLVAMPDDAAASAYFPKTGLRLIRLSGDQFRSRCVDIARDVAEAGLKPAFAWFAGEFSTANAMRKVFKDEFSLAKGRQLSVSYWEQGKRGAADRLD